MSEIAQITGKSFFENKQLVHIIAEAIICIGMVSYFSSKNKTLTTHIEHIAERLEEQEDKIQELTNTIEELKAQLVQNNQDISNRFTQQDFNIKMMLQQTISKMQVDRIGVPQQVPQQVPQVSQQIPQQVPQVSQQIPQQVPQRPRLVKKMVEEILEEDRPKIEEICADEEDLDGELMQELDELENNSNLKKQ